ncbi:MAG TPA: MarR family transcriptional regulator [Ktedonobacterales bacterium]|nr:MarR family transcriptional regulator [Ktedonobacterales bacterium]
MTDTDMQVLDILESGGPTTAGQLADLTGLTTGAITGMLNRLEEGGLVSRERDPSDGRRVIVRLASGQEGARRASAALDSMTAAWDEVIARYDDEQIALLLEFLQRGNALTRGEIARLRETPADEGKVFSAPLAELKSGQLTVSGAIPRLRVRAGDIGANLYEARFEGAVPDVKTKDAMVAIRYPRRGLLALGKREGRAEVTLSASIPWRIAIQGGATEIVTEPDGLNLAGLEIKAGVSVIHLELPAPTGAIPVLIGGAAADILVRRPKDAAARVHLKGWASHFIFDDQTFTSVGANVRLQSANFLETAPYYDIEVLSSASVVTITTQP